MRKISIALTTLLVLMALFVQEISSSAASPSPPSAPESQERIPQVVVSVDLRGEVEPDYRVIAGGISQGGVGVIPMTLYFPGQTPSSKSYWPPTGEPAAPTAEFVDNWDFLLGEDFEDVFPRGPCAVYDASGDGFDRTWGKDDHRPFEGDWAGWPASGGADGVDPAVSDYPANLDSWLICGPFDLSTAQDFLVRFTRWLEINDADDFFFVGASLDGSSFSGLAWYGVSSWVTYHVWFQGVEGDDSVWVGWLFHSDADSNRAEGAWIDNLEVWRYNTPAQVCGGLDLGDKGVVVAPYEKWMDIEVPIIRGGETEVVDGLVAADAHWLRMVFRQTSGLVNQQEYDRMVDTLCAHGISVLGVVNHETLLRQDFNDPAMAAEYRQEFTSTVEFIVDRFEGRITYWEVWNEENYRPVEDAPPWIEPELYAHLLNATYQSIKVANPQAKVIFGGLGSAWDDSHQYFQQVYDELDNNLGGARPLDYFAVHPYYPPPEWELGLDPEVYMHADQPNYDTILDKFLKTMYERNDVGKRVWVTEIGWNSAVGYEGDLRCLADVVVTREEQAEYLKSGFDILFNEVELWQQPGVKAVEKVIWFQYMDVGLSWEDACPGGAVVRGGHGWMGCIPAEGDAPWYFGLYESDQVTSKPARCAFLAYPNECRQVFLPLTSRNYLTGAER